MKITATRQALTDALLVVSRAVSARAALQALSGIHLSANGEPRLRATDMELGLDVGLDGKIESAGVVVRTQDMRSNPKSLGLAAKL